MGDFSEMLDDDLVDYIAGSNSSNVMGMNAAIAEMQRRGAVAIREFNAQSSAQTAQVIRLTRQLKWLTIVIGGIAVMQLIVMVIGLVQGGA